MKFNYEKFPILEKLDKGIFGTIGINPDHEHLLATVTMNDMRDSFKKFIPEFKKDIKYISSTLRDAIELSKSKLMQIEIVKKISGCSGTILMPNGLQMCYLINSTGDPNDEFLEYLVVVFMGNALLSFDLLGTPVSEGGPGRACYAYEGYGPDAIQPCNYNMGYLMLLLNFLKYADTETMLSEPGRPILEGPNCLYNNKSKHNIQVIDSKWITTLVKSDAFKVRGHFRLQPFGHGLKDKKLIWINEFQKEGYTREAKILSEYPSTSNTLNEHL